MKFYEEPGNFTPAEDLTQETPSIGVVDPVVSVPEVIQDQVIPIAGTSELSENPISNKELVSEVGDRSMPMQESTPDTLVGYVIDLDSSDLKGKDVELKLQHLAHGVVEHTRNN
jgi:hypothetical protein